VCVVCVVEKIAQRKYEDVGGCQSHVLGTLCIGWFLLLCIWWLSCTLVLIMQPVSYTVS